MTDLPKVSDWNDSPESSRTTQLQSGLSLVETTVDVIDFVGASFTRVFEANGSARNGTVFLRGALFALGTRDVNHEWREHSSSSLRELYHEWSGDPGAISDAFNTTFKPRNTGFPTIKTHAEDYKRLREYYGYFSDVCHHNAVDIIHHLRFFKGEAAKTGDDTPSQYIEIVKDFIVFHRSFFKEHAK